MKKYLLFAAAIVLSGCASWGQTVDDRQTSWLENNFPTGMEEPAFKAKVPAARLTVEQGTTREYRAIILRPCFILCASLDAGLRSRDLLYTEFTFENGQLVKVHAIGGG
jgi:hypothetical protein